MYMKNEENFMENLVVPAPKWPATKLAAPKSRGRSIIVIVFSWFCCRTPPRPTKIHPASREESIDEILAVPLSSPKSSGMCSSILF